MDEEILIPEEYPRWREAVKLFVAAQFQPDDIVSHDWLYEALKIKRPEAETTLEVADAAWLAFLSQFNPFRQCILEEYQIDLASVAGMGYRLTPPGEQTSLAYADGVHEVRKGLRKMQQRLINVNVAALTNEQRNENATMIARQAMLASMIRKVNRLTGPAEGE